MYTDIVEHDGQHYRLSNLVQEIGDEEREAIHSAFTGDVSDSQGWWDLFTSHYPNDADRAALNTIPTETHWDYIVGCDDLSFECRGGVMRVQDSQTAWYADRPEWDRAVLWAETVAPRFADGNNAYSDFCDECKGYDSEDEDALPLMARFAGGMYNMTTSEGREEALEDVFRGNEDNLAFACMLLDQAKETSNAG